MLLPSLAPCYTPGFELTKDNWREQAAQKRFAREALIPAEWRLSPALLALCARDPRSAARESGILTPRELELTECDELEELVEKLADGRYSAVEVTTAYCKRAAIAHQLTNCLTEIYFAEAIARARELDASLEATGSPAGPLHGVPISLKDQFDIEGRELTMGYASYLGRISERDSALVKILHDAGAVIHCRTNVPQTLLDGDTDNHVFGKTLNPLNLELGPGGSSGGEGALVALKGSILGVGTDIGGSIRIPASFCGLYGLRPTSNRVPYGFATNSLLGQRSVLSVAGPLARSISSCAFFLRTILDANPAQYDATALPFPFDASAAPRLAAYSKLAIGVIRTDGHVTPHPPVRRALEEGVKKLEEAGHEVVEMSLVDFKGVAPLLSAILTSDGAEDIFRTLAAIDEPLLPHLGFSSATAKTTYETWQMNRAKEAFQQLFLERVLATAASTTTGRPIDAVLLPTTAMTACRSGEMRWGGYTSLASLLDLPAVALPFSVVDPTVDVLEQDFVPLSENDREIQALYNPAATAGMPISLQLVGRRWKDEELLAVASRVTEALAT
ncbi:Serine/threonine kinase mps1 [Rhodotorula kratochvilovae]